MQPETAFTITTILRMITHPANMILTIWPRAIAVGNNFERIQDYLLEDAREDQQLLLQSPKLSFSQDNSSPAIKIFNLNFYDADAERYILHDINLVVNLGAILACSGPVGSGKSTLVKMILSELLPTSGTVSVVSKKNCLLFTSFMVT